jgi:hypothetical protein
MRAIATVTGLALLLAAGAAAAGSAGGTSLRIVYRADGSRPAKVTWTLRCEPTGGTLPTRAAACAALARRGAATLAPVPAATACTEIYGGPQVALVTGKVDGRRVWVKLRRDNGCEIDRWERNRFLLPVRLA